MFLFIFSALLLFANIICFVKKTYLYLFIPCLLFLPEYYGFEISASLPLITVARLMIITFYFYAFLNRRRNFTISKTIIQDIFRTYGLLFGYFAFRIIANLFYVTKTSYALNRILELIFEQVLLFVAFYYLAPNKDEQTKLIKSIVWSGTALFLIGIIESLTSFRCFDALYTVNRYMLNDHYIRLGLLRSTATFGLPNFFGNACILVFPLILYLFETTKQKRYLFCFIINIFAINHSGCRSDMIFILFILILHFVFVIKNKEKRLAFVKNATFIVCIIAVIVGTLSLSSEKYAYFYSGSVKSVLNSVGFSFDLDANSPDGVSGFGNNTDGTMNRLRQVTGLYYVFQKSPVIGMGAGAQIRGQIKYYWDNGWHTVKSYDLGIMEIFGDEGIIGLLGVISLIFFIAKDSIKSNNSVYKICPIIYLISTLSTINMFTYLFVYYFVFSEIGIDRSTDKQFS
ncbi:MAG: hypothetical protein E7307_02475 [Butyrivibrio sp.]|nr:hypothetical protein [Butyrivibrio sp.]